MKAQEVYSFIYKHILYRYMPGTPEEIDAASRVANRYAVKNTWYYYNNQHLLRKHFPTMFEEGKL